VKKKLENISKVTATGFARDSFISVATQRRTGELDGFTRLDKARKRLLHTQACDGTWRLLRTVAPSVLPYVFFSLDFWLSMFIYVGARVLLFNGVFDPSEIGSFRGLQTMGFVLALMLNFYVNTSITRLFETNKDSMNLIRGINDMALSLRGYICETEEQRDCARRAVDYMCAALVHCYIGFADEYTAENLWSGFNEEFGALTQREDNYLHNHRELGGSRMRECLAWCMEELHYAVKKGWLPPPVASGFNGIVAQFNDNAQSLFDFRYLPIPFVSEHLLVFFLHLYLPVQTFEMAVQTQWLSDGRDLDPKAKVEVAIAGRIVIEVFGFLLMALANIGFQGLFAVGAFLEQPYGNKICHSRVSTFCRIAVKDARKTLAAGSPRNFKVPLEETKALTLELQATLRSAGVDTHEHTGIRVLQDLMEDLLEQQALMAAGQQSSAVSDVSPLRNESRGDERSSRVTFSDEIDEASDLLSPGKTSI